MYAEPKIFLGRGGHLLCVVCIYVCRVSICRLVCKRYAVSGAGRFGAADMARRRGRKCMFDCLGADCIFRGNRHFRSAS